MPRRFSSSTFRERPPVAVRDTIHRVLGLAGFFSGRAATIGRSPMKALAISMVAGAALCSVMSVPASALPMTNLAAAASDLALGQSVQYGRHHPQYRVHAYRPYGYGGYGGPGVGFGYGPSYGYGY